MKLTVSRFDNELFKLLIITGYRAERKFSHKIFSNVVKSIKKNINVQVRKDSDQYLTGIKLKLEHQKNFNK